MIAVGNEEETALDAMQRDGIARLDALDLFTRAQIDAVTAAGEHWSSEAEAHPKHYALKSKPFLLSSRGTIAPEMRAMVAPLQALMSEIAGEPMQCFSAEFWGVRPVPGDYAHSQLWHRDHEDVPVLKLFLYLRDIGPKQGPLEYIRGSHRGDFDLCSRQKYAPGTILVSPERVESCTGPQGSAVIVDTSGIHRGGRITEGYRLQAVWAFLRAASPLWGKTLKGGGR